MASPTHSLRSSIPSTDIRDHSHCTCLFQSAFDLVPFANLPTFSTTHDFIRRSRYGLAPLVPSSPAHCLPFLTSPSSHRLAIGSISRSFCLSTHYRLVFWLRPSLPLRCHSFFALTPFAVCAMASSSHCKQSLLVSEVSTLICKNRLLIHRRSLPSLRPLSSPVNMNIADAFHRSLSLPTLTLLSPLPVTSSSLHRFAICHYTHAPTYSSAPFCLPTHPIQSTRPPRFVSPPSGECRFCSLAFATALS